jgi:hypothetical protein
VSDVSVWATAAVGIVGIGAAYLTAQGQRTHAEKLAREARIEAHRGESYLEVSAAVRRISAGVARNGRIVGMPGDAPPPPALDDDTTFRLDALLAAYGSDRVREAMNEWSAACWDFQLKMEDANPAHPPYPPREMRDALDAVLAAEKAIQDAVRADLGTAEEGSGT